MAARLIELRVRNLGVIEDTTLRPGPAMTALTGETGAGKTLLVGALSLLLGGRTDPSIVRAGADEAMVEARLVVPGPNNDEVTLARSVSRAGRSGAWIDGRMASIAAVAEAATGLLELHGQHEHRSLVHPAAQRQALDTFGRVDLQPLAESRSRRRRLENELVALGGDTRERAREVDLLTYQLDEIESTAIEDPGEDDRLELEEERLAEADAHRRAAEVALQAIAVADGSNALDRLAEASGALTGRPPLAGLEVRVRGAMGELSDLAAELRSVTDTWEADPERLEVVRARRQRLHELERKYGTDLAEVLRFAERARSRLDELGAANERARSLEDAIDGAARQVAVCEEAVARSRHEAAPRLASTIESTLHELAMEKARFSVLVDGFGSGDEVTFVIGVNDGEPLLPMAKVASGGELARTMLAVRLAVAEGAGVMAFDEVDAGVGGSAATAVGAALSQLARHAQVMVVTHLAQVAAQARDHVEIRKVERDGRTVSDVVPLDDEGRVVEVSRMLSGRPDSASARHHARELLNLPAAP